MKIKIILTVALALSLPRISAASDWGSAWQELTFFDGLLQIAKDTLDQRAQSLALRQLEKTGRPKAPGIEMVKVKESGQPVSNKAAYVQETIDRCIMIALYRPIATTQDFIDVYGPCIKSNPDLRVTRMSAHPQKKDHVLVLSRADSKVVEQMSGWVMLHSPENSRFVIETYPDSIIGPLNR
ncbi:MAG: hypothetical protein HY401_10620 [Elusimicrobia bacterium]|nr:hypothetical protein [Elusimicrobiota bacterium]